MPDMGIRGDQGSSDPSQSKGERGILGLPKLRGLRGQGRIFAGIISGVVAGAAGIGSAELVAALLGAPSPVVAVGGWAIDLAPPALKDFAVSQFGTADKPLLLAGLLVAVAAIAALAGVIGIGRPRLAAAVIGLLGAIGMLAAGAGRSSTGSLGVRLLPSAVALVVSVAVLLWLVHLLRTPRRTPSQTPTRPVMSPGLAPRGTPSGDELPAGFDRRRFVLSALAAGAVAVGGGGVAQLIAGRRSDPSKMLAIPRPASPAKAVPAGVSAQVAGVSPFFTPNKTFYRVDTSLTLPRIDLKGWRLRVHGMVERELDLDFAELISRRLVERDITLTCVSNEVGGPYVGNARWIGVPIADILTEAGVKPGADAVKSAAVDGFTIGTPLEALTDGRDAMFAVAMNGDPLPLAHGFPVRMVVPGLYGYVSATKWLVDVEVTRFADFKAYWSTRGWAEQAPIKTSSRIDVPKPFARVKAGKVPVAGVAWSQQRGVTKVEVRVDDGAWQTARLAAEDSIDTWRQWLWTWDDASPGNHTLQVRATDSTNTTQTSRRVPPRPNGSSGWHSVAVMVE